MNLFDLKTQKSKQVPIHVNADLPAVRPKFVKAAHADSSTADLSPSGAAAVSQSAQAEYFTCQPRRGHSQPDPHGRSGRARSGLVARRQIDRLFLGRNGRDTGCSGLGAEDGKGKAKVLKVGDSETFLYNPSWSPNSKWITCSDKKANIWLVDVKTGKSKKVDSGYYGEGPTNAVAWAPDSQWFAFARSSRLWGRSLSTR